VYQGPEMMHRLKLSMGRRSLLRSTRAAGARIAVLSLVVLTLAATALAPSTAQPATAQLAGATISSVTDTPNAYVGQTVTVTGELEEVLGPRSFLLQDDDLLSDDTLPVVTASPALARGGREADLATVLTGDETLAVTGTVHIFNLQAFEEQLGLDFDDGLFSEWGGRAAIIATAVRRLR
jgi:hypothetical protein